MSKPTKKLVYNEVKEVSFLDELLQWSKEKSLTYWIIVICSWLSVSLAFYHLFVAVYGTPEGRSFRSVHLSVMMIIAVFIFPKWFTPISAINGTLSLSPIIFDPNSTFFLIFISLRIKFSQLDLHNFYLRQMAMMYFSNQGIVYKIHLYIDFSNVDLLNHYKNYFSIHL